MFVAFLKLVTVLGLTLPGVVPDSNRLHAERAVRSLKFYREMLEEAEATRRAVELQDNGDNGDRIQMLLTLEEHLKERIKALERGLEPRPAVMPTRPLEPPVKLPVRD